jgi:hypothetical protein
VAKKAAKPTLDLDRPWVKQFDLWIRDYPGSLPFSNEAIDQARFIILCLSGTQSLPPDYEKITVRQVISRTEQELLALKGIGPRTMRVIKAFLEFYDITELGQNANQTAEESFLPDGVDLLMATGHA